MTMAGNTRRCLHVKFSREDFFHRASYGKLDWSFAGSFTFCPTVCGNDKKYFRPKDCEIGKTLFVQQQVHHWGNGNLFRKVGVPVATALPLDLCPGGTGQVIGDKS